MTVEIRVLGPVEAVLDGRPLDVGHARQQCVLAALALDANRPVPVDRLVDRVWGARPPGGARGSLHSYLSRLRRVLAPAGPEVAIVRRTGGYLLAVDPAAVDVGAFRDLVRSAAAAEGDERAADLLERALGRWRGEPFGPLDTAWIEAARADLNRERWTAELDRNDLGLRLGRHAELVAGLVAACAAHPWDERVAGQAMLALYRSGRQAEALAAYQELRQRLADELGTDPSPPLRRLHRQLLVSDPEVAAPAVPAPRRAASPRAPRTPQQLPSAPRLFAGRAAELAELDAALTGDGPVVAITGGGGLGKTWLALRWAHANAGRYPDGQLFVDLRGFDPAGEPLDASVALRSLLEALGVAADRVPVDLRGRQEAYRRLVAGRRMVIVLDDAGDTDAVVPLLPGADGCAVLVTSRRRLTGLVVAHGARAVAVPAMPAADGRALLERRLGPPRTARDAAAVDRLVELCAGLPLALAIVAARGAGGGLPDLAAAMADGAARLDALDGGEVGVDLRRVLDCSRRALTPAAARLFALLGLAPGPDVGLGAAASLAGLEPAATRAALAELVAASLVTEQPRGRFGMHDLVRLYARELAPDGSPAVRRLLDSHLHTAHRAALLLSPHRAPQPLPAPDPAAVVEELPDADAATAWFAAEERSLLAAVGLAGRSGFDEHAHRLAWTLATYLDRRGHWQDWVLVQHVAVAAAGRLGDRAAQADAVRLLANAYSNGRVYADALACLRSALELFDPGDDAAAAHVHFDIAVLLEREGRPGEAVTHGELALRGYRAAGHALGEAVALNAVGWYRCQLGAYRDGIEACRRSLELAERIGSDYGRSNALDSLGYAHFRLGEHEVATGYYRRAVEAFRAMGDRHNGAVCLDHLGDAYEALGDVMRARRAWQDALDVLDGIDHPDADRVRAKLGAPAGAGVGR